MQRLTKEERARKFEISNKNVGLRSKGHRKLTPAEQRELFVTLKNDKPSVKLANLRILREAIQSSKDEQNDIEFEEEIYSESIRESITQKQFEAVPHLLRHITGLSTDPKWNELLIISLSNSRQFHQAILRSQEPSDLMYVSSLNNWDLPLWRSLKTNQKSLIVLTLMEQVKSDFDRIYDKTQESLKLPNRSTNVNAGSG